MKREEALNRLDGILQGYLLRESINKIYNDHEEDIEKLKEEHLSLSIAYETVVMELNNLKNLKDFNEALLLGLDGKYLKIKQELEELSAEL